MKSTLFYLHALSVLHVGTGQGAGVIDLPIARERATHLPYVPGTSIKGVLREESRETLPLESWEALFGPAKIVEDNGFAGALAVGDAHLLCFPVRSLAGTFAWATCPFILARYTREARAVGVSVPSLPELPGDESALVCAATELEHKDCVVLEDLDLDAVEGADEWADHIAAAVFGNGNDWSTLFKARFVILPDGVLDFLAETATEVRARVRIDEKTRTVADGGLWYEENLPAESLLYGAVGSGRARRGPGSAEEMLQLVPTRCRLQLGGKASVGRGVVSWSRREA